MKELGRDGQALSDFTKALCLDPANKLCKREISTLKERIASQKSSVSQSTQIESPLSNQYSRSVPAETSTSPKIVAVANRPASPNPTDLSESTESIKQVENMGGAKIEVESNKNESAETEDIVPSPPANSFSRPPNSYELEKLWINHTSLFDRLEIVSTIPPETYAKFFHSSMSSAVFVTIIKLARKSIDNVESDVTFEILENLARVPRFDILLMLLSEEENSGSNSLSFSVCLSSFVSFIFSVESNFDVVASFRTIGSSEEEISVVVSMQG